MAVRPELKKQIEELYRKHPDNLYQEINLFRTAEGNQGGQGFHGLLPVSYTHLDVYKRQVHNTGGQDGS